MSDFALDDLPTDNQPIALVDLISSESSQSSQGSQPADGESLATLAPTAVEPEKKRRRYASRAMSTKLQKFSQGDDYAADVSCLRVNVVNPNKKKDARHVVPIWPLYQVADSRVSADTSMGPWIVLGHKEAWFTGLVSKVLSHSKDAPQGKNKHRAQVVSQFLKRTGIDEALAAARMHGAIAGSDDEKDNDEADKGTRMAWKATPVLRAVVLGHTVTIANSLRPKVLLLDRAARALIEDSWVPLVHTIMIEWKTKMPLLGHIEPAPFHFVASPCANHLGKVVWCPVKNGWKITTKTKGAVPVPMFETPNGTNLCVNQDLSADQQAEEKTRLYRIAVEAWNELDKSTRPRVPIPPEPPASSD